MSALFLDLFSAFLFLLIFGTFKTEFLHQWINYCGRLIVFKAEWENKIQASAKTSKIYCYSTLGKKEIKCSFQNLRRHQLFDKCASHPNCKDSVPEHRKPNCHTTLGFLRKKSLILRSLSAHATRGQMLSAVGNLAKKTQQKERAGNQQF